MLSNHYPSNTLIGTEKDPSPLRLRLDVVPTGWGRISPVAVACRITYGLGEVSAEAILLSTDHRSCLLNGVVTESLSRESASAALVCWVGGRSTRRGIR